MGKSLGDVSPMEAFASIFPVCHVRRGMRGGSGTFRQGRTQNFCHSPLLRACVCVIAQLCTSCLHPPHIRPSPLSPQVKVFSFLKLKNGFAVIFQCFKNCAGNSRPERKKTSLTSSSRVAWQLQITFPGKIRERPFCCFFFKVICCHR